MLKRKRGMNNSSREILNHFSSISRAPETAFDVISLVRKAFSSSAVVSAAPSGLSEACPFVSPFTKFVLLLRLLCASALSSTKVNPFGIPLGPFAGDTSVETLATVTFQKTMASD